MDIISTKTVIVTAKCEEKLVDRQRSKDMRRTGDVMKVLL